MNRSPVVNFRRRSNARLGMHVAPAAVMAKGIAVVYRAREGVGNFPKAPSAETVIRRRFRIACSTLPCRARVGAH
jgi:hypothetical protein